MPILKKRSSFFDTEEGIWVNDALQRMVADNLYKTDSSYSANSEIYANNQISFVAKHMKYLSEHQNVNTRHYISNLRLMTKLK